MNLRQIGCGRVPVWAPAASKVELVTERGRTEMCRRQSGWWVAPTPLPDGTDYAFSLDSGPCLPDPRASLLPTSVHGPSRTWCAPASPGPLPKVQVLGGVMYELHVGTFTPEGTLAAAAKKLPYLKELGVTCVELMPLSAFDGNVGWGYDGINPFSVHAPYGGPDGLIDFIRAAHELQLGVCIDLVLNHLGPVGNYLGQFGPYFTSRHSTPWGDGLNVDQQGLPEPREYLLHAALRLFAIFGVDALRLDAVHAIKDDSPVHLLQELSQLVNNLEQTLGRELTLIAESDLNDISMITPVTEGGLGMDGQWDDDIHHALHVAFTGESQGYYKDFSDPDALRKVYEQVFYHDGTYSSFRKRNWGRPAGNVARWRLVACDQNHDQVGNRGMGDRPNLTAAEAAAEAAMLLLSPFTPLIFMGEEWHTKVPFTFFTSFTDEDVARDVSAGRAREFASMGWADGVPDPQDLATHQKAILDWPAARSAAGARMVKFYRKLISLRQLYHLASTEVPTRLHREGGQITLDRGRVQVHVNLDQTEIGFALPKFCKSLLWNASVQGNAVTLAPKSVAVIYQP